MADIHCKPRARWSGKKNDLRVGAERMRWQHYGIYTCELRRGKLLRKTTSLQDCRRDGGRK